MGCIMTPMPNHLSTRLSLPLNHKTTQNSVGKKNGVEQMRRMVRSDELDEMVCG